MSGVGDDRDAPRPMADSLDRVVAGLAEDPRRAGGSSRAPGPTGEGDTAGRPHGRTQGASALFSRWEELVGPAIAAHARPLRLQDGRLVVLTDDPAWASQLHWLATDLVARIAESGGPRLDGIVVRVRRR